MDGILNLIIVTTFLFLPFLALQQFVPGPYRMAMRLLHLISAGIWRLIWRTQYERRGPAFTLWHSLVIFTIFATIGAVSSGTNWSFVLTLWALVIVTKWVLNRLRKLQSSRRALPSRRRW